MHLSFSRFHDNFFDGAKFHIRFTFNRLGLRLWHRAAQRLGLNQSTCQAIGFPTSKTVAQYPLLCSVEERSIFIRKYILASFTAALRDLLICCLLGFSMDNSEEILSSVKQCSTSWLELHVLLPTLCLVLLAPERP